MLILHLLPPESHESKENSWLMRIYLRNWVTWVGVVGLCESARISGFRGKCQNTGGWGGWEDGINLDKGDGQKRIGYSEPRQRERERGDH